MRPRVHAPSGYQRDHFHGRYICGRCSAEVHDWAVHDAWHDDLDALIEGTVADGLPEHWDHGLGPDDLAAAANREGGAVYDPDARGALAELRALFDWPRTWAAFRALVRRKDPRPAARSADPPDPPAAGRAEQWAAMGDLIRRTTEA